MGASNYPSLGFDPAPGDLETVRLLVSTVGNATRDTETTQTELNKLGSSDGIWVGKSADAFNDSISGIPPYLKKAVGSLDAAHRALSSWEIQLDGFQARARKLEVEAADATHRVGTTQHALDSLPSNTSSMSDTNKADYDADKRGKQRAVDDANSELSAVIQRAHKLHAEFTTEAEVTAGQIKSAADDAPPEPGLFEEALNGIAESLATAWDTITDPEFWKLIGDFLADVALVIGIICLFAMPFGGIAGLALIGLLVGAGALGFHAAAMAGGADGVTWQTLAWDAAGVLSGGVGMAGSGLAKGGRVLVMAGRSLRATRGLSATLSKIGPSLGGITKIPSGVANSARGFKMAAKGWTHVASGNMMDWSATVAGAAFAAGSNMNGGRWLDGDWNVSDLPLIGPLDGINDYSPSQDETVAPGPLGPQIDSGATLTSAGDSFTRGLDPAQFGTAA